MKLWKWLRNSLNRLKYTADELDPLSDEYVGHTIALKCGVSCCCNRSVIECPYHGR